MKMNRKKINVMVVRNTTAKVDIRLQHVESEQTRPLNTWVVDSQ